jgi:protein-disulfide isomerase
MKKYYFIALAVSMATGVVLGGFVFRKTAIDAVVVSKVLDAFDLTGCIAEGPENAPVTVVEFSDLECPFSRRNAQSIDSLKQKYQGKIRYYFRHFPLASHEHAKLKAKAVVAAAVQGKAARMREILFGIDRYTGIEQTINNIASGLEMDTAVFTATLQDSATEMAVNVDCMDGLKAGVRSTPTVFINGYLIKGAVGLETYSRVIEKLLSPHL